VRIRGIYSPGEVYLPGDLFERDGRWFVVGRNGVARPVAAKPDSLDRVPKDGRDGERGPAGRDGKDGAQGPAGPGLNYVGKWLTGQVYNVGDVVTHSGSAFVCRADGIKVPPSLVSKSWGLLAKGGRDGKDGASFTRQIVKQRETVIHGAPIAAIFDSNTSKGQVVYISGDGHVDLAHASADPQARAIGLALSAVIAGQAGEYLTSGPMTNDSWSLTPGAMYYLDPAVPGAITSTCPTANGQYVIIIGFATTPTQLNIAIHWALALGT